MNVVLKMKRVDNQTNGHTSSVWIHLTDKELFNNKTTWITHLPSSLSQLLQNQWKTAHRNTVTCNFKENLLSAILWASGLRQCVVGSGSNILYEQPVSIFCRRWQHTDLRWWCQTTWCSSMCFILQCCHITDSIASNGRTDKQWIGKGIWNKRPWPD
jgi:hypothetical protein